MKLNKKVANTVILLCAGAALLLIVLTLVFAPIVFYGWLGLMAVGMVYGSYMNRTWIRQRIRQELDKYKLEQLKEEAKESAGSGSEQNN